VSFCEVDRSYDLSEPDHVSRRMREGCRTGGGGEDGDDEEEKKKEKEEEEEDEEKWEEERWEEDKKSGSSSRPAPRLPVVRINQSTIRRK